MGTRTVIALALGLAACGIVPSTEPSIPPPPDAGPLDATRSPDASTRPNIIVLLGGGSEQALVGTRVKLDVLAAYVPCVGCWASGVPVDFTVVAGHASVTPRSTWTGNNGVAEATLALGSQPEQTVVIASSGDTTSTSTFDVTSIAGPRTVATTTGAE